MNILGGSVTLVAGAGRGIGRTVAVALAREGAHVGLMARTRTELEETAALVVAAGGSASVAPGDISSAGDVRRAVEATLSATGRLDTVVNAAGVYGPIGPTVDVDPAEWWRAAEINLLGTLLLCQAVIPAMRVQRSGRIVLFGGGGATAPLPNFSSYAASKAGVVRLAETLAEELAGDGITVNAIAPGLVDTSLQDDVLAAGERAGPLLAKIAEARRSGAGAVSPEVAAELVVFLASTASGRLTGKLIAAPYDPWRTWGGRDAELNATPLYTLRRIDPHTVRPVIPLLDEPS